MLNLDSLAPDEDETYKNFFKFDFWYLEDDERFKNQGRQLDIIFSVIVLVAMGLCFFSLASSVSANIYDQSKEISVMRSCGMTVNYILRIFIYESLILVLSCSICGFTIGVSIGNLMILQQCKITSSPYFP